MHVTNRLRHAPAMVPLVLLFSLLTFTGCAPPNESPAPTASPPPKGRVVRDGVGIKTAAHNLPPGDNGFRVVFIRLGPDEAGKRFVASVLADQPGAFELVGQDARPIPPGRYRVSVGLGREGGTDELQGMYGPDNSPIEVEVRPGEDLVIDLNNYPKDGR